MSYAASTYSMPVTISRRVAPGEALHHPEGAPRTLVMHPTTWALLAADGDPHEALNVLHRMAVGELDRRIYEATRRWAR